MSAAEAWREWFHEEWDNCDIDDDAHQEMKRTTEAAFMAGYKRALEDAADALVIEAATHEPDMPYWEGIGDGYRSAAGMVRARAAAVATTERSEG